MIETHEQAQSRAAELRSLLDLEANPEWAKIAAKIATHHREHLAGISDRQATAEQRGLHLEAYHMADELLQLIPERIKALKRELDAYRQQSGVEISMRHEVDI